LSSCDVWLQDGFCLFLIARFQLRAVGVAQVEAVAQSVAGVGAAITASALTTILGLAMMGFAEFGKFAYSGPAIAVSLAIALAVCLTLAPAMLARWAPVWERSRSKPPSVGRGPVLGGASRLRAAASRHGAGGERARGGAVGVVWGTRSGDLRHFQRVVAAKRQPARDGAVAATFSRG
jgi:multidrug efflux pump subunit AcrB